MRILINAEGRAGLAAGIAALQVGRPALEVVEAAIRPVEADPEIHSVGLGGWTNLLGQSQCDAMIMDGGTRQSGAIGGLTGYLHAVSVARAVMERLPHVVLVGEGANRFAAEIGAERAEMVTELARREHDRWLREELAPKDAERLRAELSAEEAVSRRGDLEVTADPARSVASGRAPLIDAAWASARKVSEKGTVICLVIDREGRMAAGVSSSGWAYKYPGRVGDSGVLGAGLYADARYGACGCTHTGEMTIRAGTARSVVLAMRHGATVEDACHEAVADLRALEGGLQGPVAIHAIDRDGRVCVVCTQPAGSEPGYFAWREDADGLPAESKARSR